jgi:hypothetical protein
MGDCKRLGVVVGKRRMDDDQAGLDMASEDVAHLLEGKIRMLSDLLGLDPRDM